VATARGVLRAFPPDCPPHDAVEDSFPLRNLTLPCPIGLFHSPRDFKPHRNPACGPTEGYQKELKINFILGRPNKHEWHKLCVIGLFKRE
jgi:hypothetical protein